MLSRALKLDRKRFSEVNKRSTAVTTPYFFVRLQFGAPESRFAVVVSKKVSPKAVKRNQLRRLVYSLLAEAIDALEKPVAGIVTLSLASATASREDLSAALKGALMIK
jgi:ribonuclease P protein component